MTTPITFDSVTPRFAMPLLFAGQAQKEVFVNEGVSITDALLHCVVEGVAEDPPSTPIDGTAWIVGNTPGGIWSGQAGNLACRQSGQWIFFTPTPGMRVFNRSSGQDYRRIGANWFAPTAPTTPSGGTTIDVEARAALANLLQCLRDAGTLPPA
ncbi:MAG: DUF2793 domain-containing protein [Novosphingobium sp.]